MTADVPCLKGISWTGLPSHGQAITVLLTKTNIERAGMSFTVAKRRAVMGGGLAAITGIGGKTGRAAESGPIRIGVLNDQSGAYASLTGPGSVTAARMAIEDAGGSILGRPVELLVADHQN